MLDNLNIYPTKRNRATQPARIERRNGTRLNGLPYLADERRRLHPKPLKTWAEANSARIEAINNPGLAGEAAQLQVLHFQKHSKDAQKFYEAFTAEMQTWRRPR